MFFWSGMTQGGLKKVLEKSRGHYEDFEFLTQRVPPKGLREYYNFDVELIALK